MGFWRACATACKHRHFRSAEKAHGGAISGFENDAVALGYIPNRLAEITLKRAFHFIWVSTDREE